MKKVTSKDNGSSFEHVRQSSKIWMKKKRNSILQKRLSKEKDEDKKKKLTKGTVGKKVKSTSRKALTETSKVISNATGELGTTLKWSPEKEEEESWSVGPRTLKKHVADSKETLKTVSKEVVKEKSKKPSKEASKESLDRSLKVPPVAMKEVATKPAKKCEKEKESARKEVVRPKQKNVRGNYNMKLAQLFFKRQLESQRSSTIGRRDENLEVMPESVNISSKVDTLKKKRRRHKVLDRNLFKENGEPVWVVPDRKEEVMTEDGVMTKYPELLAALDEEGLKMDDGKQWVAMIEGYSSGQLDAGILDEGFTIDMLNPFDTFSSLEERSKFFRMESVIYYTVSNLLTLSREAIERFSAIETNKGKYRRDAESRPMRADLEDQKTAVMTTIIFNMESTFSFSYDRRRPILSIQKFRKKYEDRMRASAESGRKGVRRESREGFYEPRSREAF